MGPEDEGEEGDGEGPCWEGAEGEGPEEDAGGDGEAFAAVEAELDGPEVAGGDGEACGGEPPVGEACVVGEGHGEEAAEGVEEGDDGDREPPGDPGNNLFFLVKALLRLC